MVQILLLRIIEIVTNLGTILVRRETAIMFRYSVKVLQPCFFSKNV